MSDAVFSPPPVALVYPAARVTHPDDLAWTPLADGLSFKPLRFLRDNRGWTALLRLEPGTMIPPHRHTGELHAMNLEGSRELGTGEVIGPGGYVFEPAGNVDTWKAIGDTPLVVLIVVNGAVEYLNPDGSVLVRATSSTQEAAYRQGCAASGVAPLDLTE